MKRFVLVLFLSLVVFLSCEQSSSTHKTSIHLLSIALSYPEHPNMSLFGSQRNGELILKELGYIYPKAGYNFEGLFLEDSTFLNDMKITSVNMACKSERMIKDELFSTGFDSLVNSFNYTDDDIAIFYYSGHGEMNKLIGPSNKAEDYLSDIEIFESISSIPGKKIILLDCCESGSFIPLLSQCENLAILCSSKEGVYSNQGPTPSSLESMGIFTYALLETLGMDMDKKTPKEVNGKIFFMDFAQRVKERTKEISTTMSCYDEQVPVFFHHDEDFLLISP